MEAKGGRTANPLSLLGRYVPYGGDEAFELGVIYLALHSLGGCRVAPQVVAVAAVDLWPDGSGRKSPATVGADIFQGVLNARFTKGTLVATDHRVRRIGRQVFVTEFAVWLESQHGRYHGPARATGATFISICRGRSCLRRG